MFFKKSLPSDNEITTGILAGGSTRRVFENKLYEKFFYLIKDGTFKHKITEEDASSSYSDTIIAVIDAIISTKFQEKAQLKTYVYQIFNNKCVDLIRKNATNKESVNNGISIDDFALQMPDDAKMIIESLSEEFEFEKLKQQLIKIGEKCKQMLMAWSEGFSDKEIALMLDYNSPQVAKTSRLRCLEKLKENYNLL
jgi:RNA polymerase sigma factor (sigma-70 family)